MGTNYYLKTESYPYCGLHDERNTMHIGKSSYGWCFGLHVGIWLNDTDNPPNVSSLEDWQELWSRSGWVIVDEYGNVVLPDEMLRIITLRGGQYGYTKDGADPRRHEIDGWLCIGHGPGTYDFLTGEFS
jgi:hypothetical protein